MEFKDLLFSEEFKQLINGRQFLLDNYVEDRKPKAKKGCGRTPFEIPIEEQQYDFYLPLNQLWNEYISDLIGGNYTDKSISSKLLKADMHGALISVWKASCESYEGIKGIVLQETMKTFRVITKENKIKSKEKLVIIKQDAVFLIEVCGKVVRIFGEGFLYRPADRAKAKWRQREKLKLIAKTKPEPPKS